jgi:chemotaxis protein MotA
MDLTTIVGLIATVIIIVVVLIMDGGTPGELFVHPSAILLTLFGAFTATVVTSPMKLVVALPKIIGKAFITEKFNIEESIDSLVRMADKARRDGLLALEEESKNIVDPFLKKGVMMVVDGVDPNQVRAILDTQIDHAHARHRAGAGFFAAAGGFSPTFGIIGTVMGLISVLKNLSDPAALATSIAAAFLATLWGLLSANLIFLPIAGKLKTRADEEVLVRYMQLEGIMAIQAGENPRVVRDKLNAFLSPKEAVTEEKSKANEAKKQAAA